MTSRREFLTALAAVPWGSTLLRAANHSTGKAALPAKVWSAFSRQLRPVGRILEMEGWFVWCIAPIEGPDGRAHVFFSRWPASKGMSGWINACEIAHAVAASPEGPYTFVDTVLAPRGPGYWDGTTCHNPQISKVGDRYALFYMGNANGRTDTKRIGLATADSLDGPWVRPDVPLLDTGPEGAWDDHCTTNPAFIRHPDGGYWLYYKSWNTADYASGRPPVRGNRKYGLAFADRLEGPYLRHPDNPLIDFSGLGENRQCEDACVWYEGGRFRMIVRDMGVFNHQVGLIMESVDGLSWSDPEVAYDQVSTYVTQPLAPPHLNRYGRLERPQVLLRDGRPRYLFATTQGGRFETASGFVFRIDS